MIVRPSKLDTCIYLNKLWYSKQKYKFYIFQYSDIIINYLANLYYRFVDVFQNCYIKNNITKLKKIGFTFYSGKNEQSINKKISKKQVECVSNFKNGSIQTRLKIMKYIGKSFIFSKHKYNDIQNPDNYRYYIGHNNIIKILDRIWYSEIIKLCNNNLPDSDIFKVSFDYNNKTNLLINAANKNTLSTKNVLLLDLIKAYDSLEWNVVEDLLYNSLKRKINILYAVEFVNQYMIILKNRTIHYKNININVYKGIPTGLPSSILVFTFVIDEIIYRWIKKNDFKINVDFIINIYVDDFYIKILNTSKTIKIISSLIKYLNFYKLNINFEKSKIDKDLNYMFKFKELKETDLYLGIPYTRNILLYSNIILKELYKKHKLKYSWNAIYDILLSGSNFNKKLLIGFMNYKLKPLFTETNNNIISIINKITLLV
jgi:hypothetical protein